MTLVLRQRDLSHSFFFFSLRVEHSNFFAYAIFFFFLSQKNPYIFLAQSRRHGRNHYKKKKKKKGRVVGVCMCAGRGIMIRYQQFNQGLQPSIRIPQRLKYRLYMPKEKFFFFFSREISLNCHQANCYAARSNFNRLWQNISKSFQNSFSNSKEFYHFYFIFWSAISLKIWAFLINIGMHEIFFLKLSFESIAYRNKPYTPFPNLNDFVI